MALLTCSLKLLPTSSSKPSCLHISITSDFSSSEQEKQRGSFKLNAGATLLLINTGEAFVRHSVLLLKGRKNMPLP